MIKAKSSVVIFKADDLLADLYDTLVQMKAEGLDPEIIVEESRYSDLDTGFVTEVRSEVFGKKSPNA